MRAAHDVPDGAILRDAQGVPSDSDLCADVQRSVRELLPACVVVSPTPFSVPTPSPLPPVIEKQ